MQDLVPSGVPCGHLKTLHKLTKLFLQNVYVKLCLSAAVVPVIPAMLQ